MYHTIVRRRIVALFDHLNRGDFDFVLRQFSPSAEHWFSGQHALAGARHSPALREAWYQRLHRVLPGVKFNVSKIVINGPPWNTHVAVEWSDRVFDPRGVELDPNGGVFMLTLRWGRAVELHVYCDTQGLAQNLRLISQRGVPEAVEAPLTDMPRHAPA